MKRDGQFWLSAVLLIVMAALLWQNYQLQRQVDNLSQQWVSTANSLQRQVSDIPRTLMQQLEEQASLWSASLVNYGELNQTDWTVPVTVQVTPKEVGVGTRAVLELDGQQTELVRDGVHFTGTLSVPLSGGGEGQVILTDGDGQRVGAITIYPDQSQYLLIDSNAYFSGEVSCNKQALTYDGTVDIHIQQRSDTYVWPVRGEVVLKVDGQETERQDVTFTERLGMLSVPWQRQIALEPEQQLELWCYLVDNHGLTYQLLLDSHVVGADGQAEGQNGETGTVLKISDGQGRVVYTAP